MVALIISNSYVESTILTSLKYLTKLPITSYILMNENHSDEEFFIKNHNNIVLCDNIEDCIVKCDIVIIVDCRHLPASTVEKVKSISQFHSKEVLILNTILNNEYQEDWKIDTNIFSVDIPNVCIISIGNYTQVEQTELIIHKLLCQVSENVHFQLSPAADYILKQYPNIACKYKGNCYNKQSEISVVTYLYNNMHELLQDYTLIQNINAIRPDCIIVNVESMFKDYEQMKDVFLFRFNKKIDLFVISNYSNAQSVSTASKAVYHINNPNIENYILNNSSDFENQIRTKLFSQIMLPDDISIINLNILKG